MAKAKVCWANQIIWVGFKGVIIIIINNIPLGKLCFCFLTHPFVHTGVCTVRAVAAASKAGFMLLRDIYDVTYTISARQSHMHTYGQF